MSDLFKKFIAEVYQPHLKEVESEGKKNDAKLKVKTERGEGNDLNISVEHKKGKVSTDV